MPGSLQFIFTRLLVVYISILAVPLPVAAASVTLAWDRNTDTKVVGYRVYYGTGSYSYTNAIDVGNTNQAVVSGLANGMTYYFAVTDYSANGESGFSNEVSYTVPAASTNPSAAAADSGGGCFIATAAYGSTYSSEVTALRHFRDRYLLTNLTGRAFVSLYYAISPPIADVIRESESLKALTRHALAPVVLAVKHPSGFAYAVVLLAVGLIVIGRKLARPGRMG